MKAVQHRCGKDVIRRRAVCHPAVQPRAVRALREHDGHAVMYLGLLRRSVPRHDGERL